MEEFVVVYICCKDCGEVTKTLLPLSTSLLEVKCPKCGSDNILLRGKASVRECPNCGSINTVHYADGVKVCQKCGYEWL